jgi:CHAT domain-containing protein/tetratricopeptide (TPR) repeat protein
MRRSRKTGLCVVAVVSLLAVLPGGWEAAAEGHPKPSAKPEDVQEAINNLVSQQISAQQAGDFATAVKAARAIASLVERCEGERHSTTVNARETVRWNEELLRLGEKERQEMAGSFRETAEGNALTEQHKDREAEERFRQALTIRRKALGEMNPFTAQSCGLVASSLRKQGKYAEAQPLYEQALAIYRETLGEENHETAIHYTAAAANLRDQGKYAEAQPLAEKALAIIRKTMGETDLETAAECQILAAILEGQGKHAAAQPLFEKALAILAETTDEEDSDAVSACEKLALNLYVQGKHAEAQPLFEKLLALHRKILGEEDPHIARDCNSLAFTLYAQGKYAQAQPLAEKALAILRKVLGEEHPLTARGCNNLAGILHTKHKYAEAQALFDEALAINRKTLGEEHPHTAVSCINAAGNLYAQGKYAEAQPLFEKAVAIRRKVLGKDDPDTASTCSNLAANLLRQNKIDEAVALLQDSLLGITVGWFYGGLSRGDCCVTGPLDGEITTSALRTLGRTRLEQPVEAFRQAEIGLALGLLDFPAATTAEGRQIVSLCDRLNALDQQLSSLFGPFVLSADRRTLCDQLAQQRREALAQFAPLAAGVLARQVLPLADIQKQLPADAALLLWLDVDRFGEHRACVLHPNGDPIWVHLPGSGKDGAWTDHDRDLPDRLYRLLQQPASSEAERRQLSEALAKQRLAPLLPHLEAADGLPAVRQLLVVPTGWAAFVPLEMLTSDYRIRYVPSGSAYARIRQQHRPVAGSSLLALGDPAVAPSVPDFFPLDSPRRAEPEPLPGTRREVQALARLVPHTTLLLGSNASEQRLEELAQGGKLKDFRLIHLGTHAEVDGQTPAKSRLLLARDRLPDPNDIPPGCKPYTGALTVADVRRSWHLDADVVALSACRTAPGREGHGDGLLGFVQAFLQCGARSVVLSRWKVDDTARALLMQRFYENLLGARKELRQPLPRAEALEEAKQWLRELPRSEVENLASVLASCPAGTVRGLGVDRNGKEPPPKLPEGSKPYAHPCHWAAFVLLGDPE